MNKFKTGDRVILITERHGCDCYNPVWGRYGADIVGTIIRCNESFVVDDLRINVKWDNGMKNIYHYSDLELYKRGCLTELKDFINETFVI